MSDENGGEAPAEPAKPKAKPANQPKLNAHYSGLNRFRVEQATDAGPMTWVFARQGLFGWKLIRIELPPKIFEQG
jgi:hypothetical protein